MALPTLLDIARQNCADWEVGLIDEVVRGHPEVEFGNARTIPGLAYETLVYTGAGNAGGSFRKANAGVAPHKHASELRRVETYVLQPLWMADRAVADRSIDGYAAYIARESAMTMEAELQGLGKQFFYGADATGYGTSAAGNTAGFPGLIDAYDATNMAVKVTSSGATASTGSSVWLVQFGPKAVQWVWGQGGQLAFSPLRTQWFVDPNDATKWIEQYVQSMLAYPGLQVGSLRSVARIYNVTADASHTLTDKMITQALAKFIEGIEPNAIFMSRRSAQQLQASRTAANPTGAQVPWVREIEGRNGQMIPLYVTGSLSDTESIIAD